MMAQDRPANRAEQITTLHAYADLVQMPTLVLDQSRKTVSPRIDERRFSIRVDSGPWFRVTHVRAEGDDPISLSILLDRSALDLMPAIASEIANLAATLLTTRDHISIYGLGCGLHRSLHNAAAKDATIFARVDAVVIPWKSFIENESPCTENPVYLWDALGFIAKQMEEVPARRVILVISDGRDKGSAHSWNQVREYAQIAGIAVFGITMLPRSSSVIVARTDANPFLSICELSGGILLPTIPPLMDRTLQRLITMVRERYILEFPRPSNATKGEHAVETKIAGGDSYYIRSTGVSVRLPDEFILKDPTTVPSDPTRAPEQGKRRILHP
jgi:hypothetical protein